ncbi:TVP38/TMEM64 family protein [Ectobacillus ponti]|uniref:TVP38/TMEM64 family membrane protein n=1 Tax=Ectobacillus ponti TaxID=2961894 RepID=A0AA42BS32_9BACI|nr:VTT domain-containing protein [Ectobacillus ponti]MCP8970149.1 VTT domain-containing protein [Ectobacillus ponti]
MKKLLMPAAALLIWASLFLWAHQAGLTGMGMKGIVERIQVYGTWTPYIFVGLFLARMVLFIPGSVCIFIGSLLFSPVQAVLLSLAGIVLAETVVYLGGKWLADSAMYERMMKKYPRIYELLEQHRAKFLTFAVACPCMPTDAACFTAAATGMKYRTFLLSVITGAIPMVILYTVAGNALLQPSPLLLVVLIVLLLIGIIAIFAWNKWGRVREEEVLRVHM